jgi:hypothetical protein
MDNNEQNNLPEIKTPEQLRDEELRQYWLDPREDYPEPYNMLEFNGVPFSTIGGLQAISGQKKNGKTFVLTQLMAAVLGRGTERIKRYLPGLVCPQRTVDYLGHEPKVLYCDTEMEKLNSAKVLRRVHWLCGWDIKQPNDRLRFLWLRAVKSDTESPHAMRLRLILAAIESYAPDFVVIDGVRDIMSDFNDNAESSALVLNLMQIATEKRICIWLALHMNPRPRNDDESKMRGHLGTELGNKVTDTLVSIKKKQGTEVTFTVQQQDARSKDMEDWNYIVTDDAGALGIPKIINPQSKLSEAQKQLVSDEEKAVKDTVNALREIITPPNSEYVTKIIDKLRGKLGVGEIKAKKYFTKVTEQYPALMRKLADGRYTLSKKELEAFDDGLPFAP